jgi:hypothetical protein
VHNHGLLSHGDLAREELVGVVAVRKLHKDVEVVGGRVNREIASESAKRKAKAINHIHDKRKQEI